MGAIIDSIDIARSPEDVFAYLDQLGRHAEWQSAIVEVRREGDGPVTVGTRATERRRVPGGEQTMTYEITEHDAPRRVAFRTLDGPIRPCGVVTLEALDGGGRARMTIELTMEGHGLGRVIAPLARRHARKTVPEDQRRLKEVLESGGDR